MRSSSRSPSGCTTRSTATPARRVRWASRGRALRPDHAAANAARTARPGPPRRHRAAARPADRRAGRAAGRRRARTWCGAATSASTGRTTPPAARGTFLRPHLAAAHGYVFSRRPYVPSWLARRRRSAIIPPSIDPFSPKNQELDAGHGRGRSCHDRRAGRRAGRGRRAGSSGATALSGEVVRRAVDGRGRPARPRRPDGRPGLPLGPAQGHGRGDARLRRARRAGRPRPPACWSDPPVSGVSRRPRGRRRLRRVRAAVAGAAGRRPGRGCSW